MPKMSEVEKATKEHVLSCKAKALEQLANGAKGMEVWDKFMANMLSKVELTRWHPRMIEGARRAAFRGFKTDEDIKKFIEGFKK